MKYLIRVVKYFVYITIVMAAILFVLVQLKLVESDVTMLFRNGYDSIWQIALMFLAVSAFYPKFGYCKRAAIVPGEYRELRGGLVSYMEERGYILESEENENLSFRCRSGFGKARRIWEDRLTFTRELPGFYIEGPTKDVIRVINGLEFKFREQ